MIFYLHLDNQNHISHGQLYNNPRDLLDFNAIFQNLYRSSCKRVKIT